MHKQFLDTISTPDIPDYQSGAGRAFKPFKQYVYDVLLTVSQYTRNHTKRYIPIIRNLSCNLSGNRVYFLLQRVNSIKTRPSRKRREV